MAGLAILLPVCALAQEGQRLWYRQPAAKWTEALPIGNGRLGAMVFGGVEEEHLQLNESTIWAGEVRDRNNPQGREGFLEARRLMAQGKVHEAEKVVDEKVIGVPRRMPPYQPLGDLRIRMTGQTDVEDYRRELDLDRAIASVQYKAGGDAYTREIFATAVDGWIVVRLTVDKPGKLSFTVALSRDQDAETRVLDAAAPAGPRLLLEGEAIAHDKNHEFERKTGVKFVSLVRVVAPGATVAGDSGHLVVSGATTAVLFLAAETSFRHSDPLAACTRDLATIGRPYEVIRGEHIQDYQRYFRRVALQLGPKDSSGDSVPADQRLERVRTGAIDLDLVSLYFQFGRYLLISCSRPGGLAANLQGMWNDSFAPSWDSKFTININTEMNYWPVETTNLTEMHEPLFDLVDRARPAGRITAGKLYGAKGFVLHHNTDIWGNSVPIDGARSGMWAMGGAWLSLDFWERYAFTLDKEFLARRAYPVLKEASEFLLDYLTPDSTGHLVTGPSVSPENRYKLPDGSAAFLSMGPFMDIEITRAVFDRTLKAWNILSGSQADSRADKAFCERVRSAMAILPPLKIGRFGRLQEWQEDYEDVEPGHRHVSNLFALHPDHQISPRGTPELAQAARKTLELRLANGGGHTGWSRAWIINFWARLLEGDLAWENIQALLAKSTLPDFLDTHPPFQIDGNFGATAAIAEMLLQSQNGEVEFLPALPKAWSQGSVRGLRSRGNLEVDLAWSGGKAVEAALRAGSNGEVRLRAPKGQTISAVRNASGNLPLKAEGGNVLVSLSAGQAYKVEFRAGLRMPAIQIAPD